MIDKWGYRMFHYYAKKAVQNYAIVCNCEMKHKDINA